MREADGSEDGATDTSSDWVSASEIAAYTYCARAYWLERVQSVPRPVAGGGGGESRLASGTLQHQAHGRRVEWQRWLVRAALVLLAAAAILVGVQRTVRRAQPVETPVPSSPQ
jgi:hypothetical protein